MSLARGEKSFAAMADMQERCASQQSALCQAKRDVSTQQKVLHCYEISRNLT